MKSVPVSMFSGSGVGETDETLLDAEEDPEEEEEDSDDDGDCGRRRSFLEKPAARLRSPLTSG